MFPGFVLRELLGNTKLSLVDKAVCMLIAEFHPRCMCELATNAGTSRTPVTKACKNLAGEGWASLIEASQKVRPVTRMPQSCQEKMTDFLEAAYEVAGNKGEFLMKRCLDLWIQSDEFVDNARPKFLTNPTTGEPLEYDRYYLQKVAFEFNGTQHYETTEVFNDEKALGEAKARDLMKEALSRRNGVTLITVTSDDLDPAVFGRVVPPNLFINAFVEGPYMEALSRICKAYRARVTRQNRSVPPAKTVTRK
jgi:hypothetical protein